VPPKPVAKSRKPTAKPRVPSTGRTGVPRRTLLIALGAAAVVAALAIVLSVVLSGGGKKKPEVPTTIDGNIAAVVGIPQHGLVLGNPLARVTLTEYIDTSCPVCKDYVLTTFPALSQEYVRTGKVKVEARVLAFVGPSSERGRQLLLAAARQNKAWQLSELLYHNQGDENDDWLTDDFARRLAAKVPGLDVAKLFSDAGSEAVKTQASAMDAEASNDNVDGSPTFVLTTPDGKRHLLGAGSPGVAPFRSAFDKALAG
jgi:protein-disulfide isomerase